MKLALASFITLALVAQDPQQEPTFRAATDAVLVDVGVQSGRRPVPGLSKAELAVADNGVSQTIDDVTVASDPVDLELLVDTGGELRTMGPMIERDVASVRSLLVQGDRSAVVTFDSQIRAGRPSADPASRGERGTVLFDAIAAALMQQEEPGRRRVVVVVTAGLDTHSLLPATIQRAILQRSQPPVFLIAAGQRPTVVVYGMSGASGAPNVNAEASLAADYRPALREVADVTGGRLFDLQEGESFLTPLRDALAEFRTRYILHYRPTGVAKSGWHELAVKVTRPGSFDVRARRGYWRD